MPHGKLVKELGDRYFYDRQRHVYFVYEGNLLMITDWDGGDTWTAKNAVGQNVRVPSEFFSGYGVFQWPNLGYRKLTEHVSARLSKLKDTRPGIKQGMTSSEYSPMSQFLLDNGEVERPSDWQTMTAIFLPKYDTLDDLPALFAGDKAGLVLSEQLMIEPSLRDYEDLYDIMHRGSIIGALTPKKEVVANGKNKTLIRSLLHVRA